MNKKILDELIIRLIVGAVTVLFGFAVQALHSISQDLSQLQKSVAEISYKMTDYDKRLQVLEERK